MNKNSIILGIILQLIASFLVYIYSLNFYDGWLFLLGIFILAWGLGKE